jgi:hypothetical protein
VSVVQNVRVRDVEFQLLMLTPQQALSEFPDIVHDEKTSVYAVASCDTSKGEFVCILPLDGRVAVMERDLAKKLVSAAYDELARKWAEEGYDKE